VITADTITDEQIEALRSLAVENKQAYNLHASSTVIRFATHALGESKWVSGVDCRIPYGMDRSYIDEGRARCAEVLNTRNARQAVSK
jgi:hypothetical protein